MRKIITTLMILFLMVMTAAGCASGNGSGNLDPFVGEWSCAESSPENPDGYTGFYALSVSDDGQFSLYDAEAGNPGIAGTMTVDSDSEVTLACQEEDFDPPAGWMDMDQTQTMQYEFKDDNELHLIYTGKDGTSTLVFNREKE